MIFTRTKRNADRVAEDLDFRGFAAAAVHGDLNQGARERALRAFRAGKIDVLVATDVAARGLDVVGVTHVINYDCPEDPDTYTHRIGRTGRAGASGVAVTFVDWEDMPRWQLIDKSIGMDLPEPPETYHTSPWLYTDLSIPTEVTSHAADRRPHARRPVAPRRKKTSAVAGVASARRPGWRRAGPRRSRWLGRRADVQPVEAAPVERWPLQRAPAGRDAAATTRRRRQRSGGARRGERRGAAGVDG